jgi:hypothetical protein
MVQNTLFLLYFISHPDSYSPVEHPACVPKNPFLLKLFPDWAIVSKGTVGSELKIIPRFQKLHIIERVCCGSARLEKNGKAKK